MIKEKNLIIYDIIMTKKGFIVISLSIVIGMILGKLISFLILKHGV